jgi:hypothetical protein
VLSLAFGVFFALFVSLLLVPAMYLVGYDWQQMRLARKRRRTASPGADAAASMPV